MNAAARVLVVDDSPTMRGLISAVLRADPEVDVVGQAGDALEARAAIKALNPDVVTLDIEMPNMNGLDFLEKIMTLRPMPVGFEGVLGATGEVELLRQPAPTMQTSAATSANVTGRNVLMTDYSSGDSRSTIDSEGATPGERRSRESYRRSAERLRCRVVQKRT